MRRPVFAVLVVSPPNRPNSRTVRGLEDGLMVMVSSSRWVQPRAGWPAASMYRISVNATALRAISRYSRAVSAVGRGTVRSQAESPAPTAQKLIPIAFGSFLNRAATRGHADETIKLCRHRPDCHQTPPRSETLSQ